MANSPVEPMSRPFSIAALAKKAGLDGFILGLLVMVFLAWLWPEGGENNSPLKLDEISSYGVSLIFFFYGLRLNLENLKAGLSKWRVHLTVHSTTFILFPVLVLVARYFLENDENHLLWLGIFFLASLPSTVSSSVVMVSIAGGNMPAAIFNASISSFIGIFITPLWMSLVLTTSTGDFDMRSIVFKLILQVLVPVVAGILLHGRLGGFAEKHRKTLRYFDQSIILLIVYTSFCESFARKMFSGYTFLNILILCLCMIGLFFLVYMIVRAITRILHFNREDTITALFCGSKKSLVHGTVMSKVLFPASDIVGIVLLPLMLYHALQLVAASIIAQAMARNQQTW
ncbi:MAG TPA: bile acid:sodium symporter family protein [Chitinophagaceae bacterium]|nr:bile acid:sodium symporter family protein [Chitinophagaceae bacterium]